MVSATTCRNTHVLTRRVHTSCCQPLSSPSLCCDSPVIPHASLTSALGPLGDHIAFAKILMSVCRGASRWLLTSARGQQNDRQRWQMLRRCRDNDHTHSVCSTMDGFELSNMIKTRGPGGPWIRRMHERKALFYSSYQPLVRLHWQPGIAV